MKNGGQIKRTVVEQNPQQVKIEVDHSIGGKNKNYLVEPSREGAMLSFILLIGLRKWKLVRQKKIPIAFGKKIGK